MCSTLNFICLDIRSQVASRTRYYARTRNIYLFTIYVFKRLNMCMAVCICAFFFSSYIFIPERGMCATEYVYLFVHPSVRRKYHIRYRCDHTRYIYMYIQCADVKSIHIYLPLSINTKCWGERMRERIVRVSVCECKRARCLFSFSISQL